MPVEFHTARRGSGPRTRFLWIVAGVVWALLVTAGLGVLAAYETRPAPDVEACRTWPGATSLERGDAAWTLLVFAHPRCPCTRATFEELERALVSRPDDLAVSVVFFRPSDEPDAWIESDLARRARSWPRTSISSDPDGVESRRFGAPASGMVFLFDRDGNARFAGGVTRSRGHAGANAGRQALVARWGEGQDAASSFPVFGCRLTEARPCPECP